MEPVKLDELVVSGRWDTLGRDLTDPSMSHAVNAHLRALGSGARQALDRPSMDSTATAAPLTAAANMLCTSARAGSRSSHSSEQLCC